MFDTYKLQVPGNAVSQTAQLFLPSWNVQSLCIFKTSTGYTIAYFNVFFFQDDHVEDHSSLDVNAKTRPSLDKGRQHDTMKVTDVTSRRSFKYAAGPKYPRNLTLLFPVESYEAMEEKPATVLTSNCNGSQKSCSGRWLSRAPYFIIISEVFHLIIRKETYAVKLLQLILVARGEAA